MRRAHTEGAQKVSARIEEPLRKIAEEIFQAHREMRLRKKVNAKIILADYFLMHLLFTDFYFNLYFCIGRGM